MIVAAANVGTRERLRAQVLSAGLPCDEEVASAALLERSLALCDPVQPALVVVAQDEDAALARLALGHGTPVLTWPVSGRDAGQAIASAHEDRSSASVHRDMPHAEAPRLTAREREILTLVAAGTSNKGIARTLRISPNTVKFHLTTLFGKLGVTTRAEALAAAARSGELAL